MTQQKATLQELISLAQQQGFLTYDQVGSYLPDETYGTERIEAC